MVGRIIFFLIVLFISGFLSSRLGNTAHGQVHRGTDSLMPLWAQDAEMREKIFEVLYLPDEELIKELFKWPKFNQMNLEEKGWFLQRIAIMRNKQKELARAKARQMGLSLNEDQLNAFERKFWTKRLEIEKRFIQETEARRKELAKELEEELQKEFSSSSLDSSKPMQARSKTN